MSFRGITYLLLFLILTPPVLIAQQTADLFGKVTGEGGGALDLVNVAVVGSPVGTTTNNAGGYRLRIPAGKELIIDFSFVGYQTQKFQVTLQEGSQRELDVVMKVSTTQLPGIEVKDEQIRTTNYIRLDPKEAKLTPSISGGIEAMLKTLPGVSSTNELSSQYMVRGGNFDENLVYVNGIEIYRPFLIRSGQQEGLSFVNTSLASSVLFSAGGWEAKYGDKMSSVLDVNYKKPTTFGGSAQVSLLGADGHVEGASKNRRFTYLAGVRYKTNQYVLKALETKGAYKPNFVDIQSLFTYQLTEKLDVSLLGYYSRNSYLLVPESRETNFGTISEAYRLQIYFDGQEVDRYKMYMGALSFNYQPSKDLNLKLITSAFQTLESETFDIRSQYWIGRLESSSDDEQYGNVVSVQGVGTNMDHARNFLDGRVYSVEHKGSWNNPKNYLQWGLKYQHEDIDDRMGEWELIDSAGFSLPHPPNNIGGLIDPKDPFAIHKNVKSNISLGTNRIMGFLQDNWEFLGNGRLLSLNAGIRFNYWDYNNEFLLSPRASLSYKPAWEKNIVFRLSAGYYYQPPFYKELRNMLGEVNPDIKAQKSIHIVAGSDWTFQAWNRPFKFVTEIYYKYMDDLIPYIVDNVQIRYFATNNSKGYATGIDMKINGEFIKGIESWMSLSVMKTMEDIKDDFYYDYFNESGQKIVPGIDDNIAADSILVQPGYIPRPTDQRVNFALFFQDYLPRNPTYSMHMTLVFGTGLPLGPPDSPKYKQTLRYPPYRRVDVGFAKQFIGETTQFKKEKNPLRHISNAWISLEVFNLFGVNNTISYTWVTDVNGRQYGVPNYLTPRRINLKLLVEF